MPTVLGPPEPKSAEAATAFRYWHVWVGVGGLIYYGRRLYSSPSIVVRAADLLGLLDRTRVEKDRIRPLRTRAGS